MTFKERIPYFGFGLVIGIIIVIFVLNKKDTEFDYGPNARVLKNLRTKERLLSEEATNALIKNDIDTSAISAILKNGNVDIGNKIKLDSCFYQYSIRGKKELNKVLISVKNCDSTIIISSITIE